MTDSSGGFYTCSTCGVDMRLHTSHARAHEAATQGGKS